MAAILTLMSRRVAIDIAKYNMRIDHKLQRVQVDSFEIGDELVYRYFDSLPETERESPTPCYPYRSSGHDGRQILCIPFKDNG